ncbi:hypothetical protein MSZK_43180 [Mycobacterium sp. shizuoka-1]|nr:hypothetical protein MSZK_43180 [Mycobacterium sp. shizuoka-1]
MQPFGRPAEVQFLGDREERLEVVQLHSPQLLHKRQQCIPDCVLDAQETVSHRGIRGIALVLDAVRMFVRKDVVAAEHEIRIEFPTGSGRRPPLWAMGLFGFAIPEGTAGAGSRCTKKMELGWTNPAFRSMRGTNNGIAGQVLVNYCHAGTPEQVPTRSGRWPNRRVLRTHRIKPGRPGRPDPRRHGIHARGTGRAV